MNKTEEKRSNWYVFLIIGILIGAVLGYYAATKGWLGENTVGRAPNYFRCVQDCKIYGSPGDVGCGSGCGCIANGGTYNGCWGFD